MAEPTLHELVHRLIKQTFDKERNFPLRRDIKATRISGATLTKWPAEDGSADSFSPLRITVSDTEMLADLRGLLKALLRTDPDRYKTLPRTGLSVSLGGSPKMDQYQRWAYWNIEGVGEVLIHYSYKLKQE